MTMTGMMGTGATIATAIGMGDTAIGGTGMVTMSLFRSVLGLVSRFIEQFHSNARNRIGEGITMVREPFHSGSRQLGSTM
jgi:hypothetical protein